MKTIKNGVWATMITPFTKENKLDYEAIEKLIEWYVGNRIAGIFAVCQSSEMFYLSAEERYDLARFVMEKTAGRLGVVVSSHVSDSLEDQKQELLKMASLKPDAVVMVSNRLAAQGEDSSVFIENVKALMEALPESVPLGMYECPYPYKRLLTDEELSFLVESGRFLFLKDTSCDIEVLKRRSRLVEGSPFKIFNANGATLLDSLRVGISGYCGVMCNFHPDLYVHVCENYKDPSVDELFTELGFTSVIEARTYPVCSKRYLREYENIPMEDDSRSMSKKGYIPSFDYELAMFRDITLRLRKKAGLV